MEFNPIWKLRNKCENEGRPLDPVCGIRGVMYVQGRGGVHADKHQHCTFLWLF